MLHALKELLANSGEPAEPPGDQIGSGKEVLASDHVTIVVSHASSMVALAVTLTLD